MDVELGELEINKIDDKSASDPDINSAEGTGLMNPTFDQELQPQTPSHSAPGAISIVNTRV